MEIYARIGAPVLIGIAALVLLAGGHGGTAALTAFIAVAALAFLSGVLLCAAVMTLVLRRRLARPAATSAPALYRVSPAAVPAREARAITPAPVVNVHLGADLLGLLREQATPAIPPAIEEHRHG